jgi:lysophospholipase L1-like esterase
VTNQKVVVIIGDSISGYYTPTVRDLLAHDPITIEQFFGGDSEQLLASLPDILDDSKPDLIQFNCGLHDLRFHRETWRYQQPIANYQANLQHIVAWLQGNTRGKLLWASTTPVITERITLEYVRFEPDVLAYNASAKTIMDMAGIPTNDLHAAVATDSIIECIGSDGVHMAERGNATLGLAVAAAIRSALT